ncbi:MAG: formate dehydrogenase accessory sulfurtransferase FdhD [Chloroflexi bacterium]|nr:formate dehydrogenase accessory sulfurtransferase FdhD [Chloroflexota bacterium]
MENSEAEKFSVLRLTRESKSTVEELLAREMPVTIMMNGEELVTMLCTPKDLHYLTAGFLVSEGMLKGKSKDEIKRIAVDDVRGVVRVETAEARDAAQEILFKRVITTGCGRGAAFYSAADAASHKVESQTKITVDEVFDLVNEFQHNSEVYLSTHGVHSAALCDTENILVFAEDIGRHNAVDKVFGECLMKGIPTEGQVIITSGRVSSEILHKVAKRDVPIVVSISAPTNLGAKIADSLGITLIGLVRGRKMNVYTNDWRVIARDGAIPESPQLEAMAKDPRLP